MFKEKENSRTLYSVRINERKKSFTHYLRLCFSQYIYYEENERLCNPLELQLSQGEIQLIHLSCHPSRGDHSVRSVLTLETVKREPEKHTLLFSPITFYT